MSKINNLEQIITQATQEVGNTLLFGSLATAAVLSTVQLSDGREKAVVPAVAAFAPITDVHELNPVDTDNTMRREKENEVGAHGAIYTVNRSTPSRAAGKH